MNALAGRIAELLKDAPQGDREVARRALLTLVPTVNPKRLSITGESVDHHGDERSPRIDLARRGRAVPVARSLANRSSRPSALAHCAEA
jgi:hypothetical protein